MGLTKYDIELDLENRKGTSHALLVELAGANKRVLDVGCDTGYLGEALVALGCTVDGFEVNRVAADQARTRIGRVEVGDLEQSDLVKVFDAGIYDVVVFGDVLEHLRDPLPTLRQSRRLLAPGGSVLISVPNIAHGDIRMALLQGRWTYTSVGLLDDTHTRFFTRDSLVSFLADAGFVLVDLRRSYAPLFGTEVPLDRDAVPAEVVAALQQDPEASTYQFVLRAVPDDAATAQAEQALRVDELTAELTALRERAAAEREATAAEHAREVVALVEQRDALSTQLGALEAEVRSLGAERDALQVERDTARDELRQLSDTNAVRLARRIRRGPS